MNKKLKNIFLIGPSRAGKTTFAKELCKYGYNHLIMDAVIETMAECFPESGIRHGNLESPEFKNFFKSYCKNNFKYGLSYIVDLEVLSPEFAKQLIDKDESIAIYLGYPSITPQEKLNQIRTYDTKFDWTKNLSDAELLSMSNKLIATSKTLKNEAILNDFLFIDTSHNREEKFKNFINANLKQNSTLLYRDISSYDKYER